MTDNGSQHALRPHARTRLFALCTALLLSMAPLSGTVADDVSAPEPQQRTVDLTYEFTVLGLPENATAVSAWIPIPRENSHQQLHDYRINTDHSPTTTEEDELGNRYLLFDLSEASPPDETKARVSVTFTVTRRAYRVPDADGSESSAETVARRFLSPNRLIPLGGRIAREARQVAGDEKGNFRRARRLYNHIVETMTYDKSGEGWGRGDALYACSVREGNCTDFHSLFIGEARALDIPARFIMGVPLTPDSTGGNIGGYHCWAEFHAEEHSWVPLDASEASKNPDRREELFGGLDAHRVSFTVGRDITIPGASAGPQNYVIYPHVEVNGSVWDEVTTNLSFRELQVTRQKNAQ